MNLRNKTLTVFVLVALIFLTIACSVSRPGSKNELSVLAGSELSDLEPMLDQIEQDTGIRLVMEYTGTLDGAERLLSGEDVDLAWFSHAKYLNLLEGAQSKVKGQEKIMLSPVVLGVKQTLAEEWGWIDNPKVTWRDIAEKASNGELRYAMTNPASSNSGFSALVGAASALSGKGDALQTEDIVQVQADLQSFFKGQALTAGSSGWLADKYVDEQDRLDGLINYESVLLRLNKDGQLKEKLYLVYPQEGIITADYPLLLINEDNRGEFDTLVTYLRSAEFQKQIMEVTLRRPVNPQVELSANFPDRILVELPFPSNREVIDQLLFSYLDEQVKPSHTFYVLDVSGSMSGDRLASLQQAMNNLTGMDSSLAGQFARFRNREKITLITFNDEIVDRSNFEVDIDQPDSFEQIRTYIESIETNGKTAIYSALADAYRLAAESQVQNPERTVSIVLMSDGQNNSGISEDTFLRDYQSTSGADQIRTFTIVFGEADRETMQSIADVTGGRLFDASSDPLSSIFKEIRGYQ